MLNFITARRRVVPARRLFSNYGGQVCARLMTQESKLIRLWLKWVESELIVN